MIKKFLILIISLFLLSTGYVFASGGHDKGSSYENSKTKNFSENTVEVGNKICPVSKEGVDSAGGKVQVEYNGKIYNLCCKMCLKDFKKNPEKFSKIAEKEVAESNHEKSESQRKGNSHSDEKEKRSHEEHNHSGQDH